MKTVQFQEKAKTTSGRWRLVLAICLVVMLSSLMVQGQSESISDNRLMKGVHLDPLAALDGRQEILVGYEWAWSKLRFLDIGMGYRFQYPEDPKLKPYENETFQRLVRKECYQEYTFYFIPIGGTCDGLDSPNDPTPKTNVDKYLRSEGFIKLNMKLFSDDGSGNAGNAFVKCGLQVGFRSVNEYRHTTGNIYRDKTTVSSYVEGTSFEGTIYYTYEWKSFDYEKLTKKKVNEVYILPQVGLGYRIRVADGFTVDLGGTVYYGDKYKKDSIKRGFHAHGDVQLGYWF